MYIRKGVRPRIEIWETPVLTGYSCEDFSSRMIGNRQLLRKDKMRPNISPENPQD